MTGQKTITKAWSANPMRALGVPGAFAYRCMTGPRMVLVIIVTGQTNKCVLRRWCPWIPQTSTKLIFAVLCNILGSDCSRCFLAGMTAWHGVCCALTRTWKPNHRPRFNEIRNPRFSDDMTMTSNIDVMSLCYCSSRFYGSLWVHISDDWVESCFWHMMASMQTSIDPSLAHQLSTIIDTEYRINYQFHRKIIVAFYGYHTIWLPIHSIGWYTDSLCVFYWVKFDIDKTFPAQK